MSVTVVNKRTFRGSGIYIGRGSVFWNPFPVSMGRAQCITAYKERFYRLLAQDDDFSLAMRALLERSRTEKLFLVCFCAPLACHGDVIKEWIEDNV